MSDCRVPMPTYNDQLELIPSGNKECPFCHGRKTTIKPVWKTHYFVACDRCKAGGPIRKTRAEAMQAWNSRPDEEASA